MRKAIFVTVLLVVTAVPLVLTLSHAASNDRTYSVQDLTTASTAVAPGEGSYLSCGANTSLVVKCSQASEWQTVPEGGTLTATCGASDPRLHYAEGTYTQAYYSVAWDCETGQNVSVSGTRTVCHSVNFTHSTSCQ